MDPEKRGVPPQADQHDQDGLPLRYYCLPASYGRDSYLPTALRAKRATQVVAACGSNYSASMQHTTLLLLLTSHLGALEPRDCPGGLSVGLRMSVVVSSCLH